MRRRTHAQFEQPKPPLQDFTVTVCVIPGENRREAWPDDQAVGFYRNFGLRASPDRLRSLLEAQTPEGRIRWDRTDWQRVSPEDIDPDIMRLVTPVENEGVWYKSGHVFFSEW
jgi:hypothetical protein